MLASYESSQHCAGVVTFPVEPDPDLPQNSSFSTGFAKATVNVQMQCQVVLQVWVRFELVCDDPKNTVLMMHFLIGLQKEMTEDEMRQSGYTVEMAFLDMEKMK